MPSSSEVRARQPSLASRLTSSNLRGVPSGLEVSKLIAPVYPTVAATMRVDAGDLGYRRGLVGRLQRSGQHGILAQRLRRQLRIDTGRAEKHQRIDTGRAEKHQLLEAVDMRGVNHIGRDDQIVIEEFTAQGVVGDDATDLRRRQKHRLRPRFREPANTAV